MDRVVEPLAPGYAYLHGWPFAHLVVATGTRDVSTACGLRGRRVTNEGVSEMVRCVLCDLAQD